MDRAPDAFVLRCGLWTGRPPLQVEELLQGGLETLGPNLRERLPVLPSVRVAGWATSAETAHLRARPEFEAALEAIVMKALSKDHGQRHQGVDRLAADLRHLLGLESAASPTRRLFRRWFQRPPGVA